MNKSAGARKSPPAPQYHPGGGGGGDFCPPFVHVVVEWPLRKDLFGGWYGSIVALNCILKSIFFCPFTEGSTCYRITRSLSLSWTNMAIFWQITEFCLMQQSQNMEWIWILHKGFANANFDHAVIFDISRKVFYQFSFDWVGTFMEHLKHHS